MTSPTYVIASMKTLTEISLSYNIMFALKKVKRVVVQATLTKPRKSTEKSTKD